MWTCRRLTPLRRAVALNACSACSSSSPISRGFLSDSFSCPGPWESRLKSPLVAKIDPATFFYDVEKKFSRENRGSAIDIDLFAQKAQTEDDIDHLEELVYKFRRTPQTIQTLPSTYYAVVRAFVEAGKTDTLMRMIDDRFNYGLFPDDAALLFLINHFVKNENWRDGSKVGIHMMLQEDLNVPVASPMALLSIFRYVLADGPENPEPWEPQAPAPKEEPEDDVKIRVDFLDSEFTDDHFDLKKKEHLLGKTLVQLSRKQGEQPVFKSLELLGWILFEKWDHVLDTPHTTEVAKDCLDKAKDLVNAAEFEQKESLLKHLEEFKASDSLDTGEILTDLIKSAVKEHEPRYIQSQVENFQSWERAREAEMKKQLELYNRESRIEEIKRRKREFEEREKKLFFFERQDEFEQFKEDKILAWRKQLPRRTWTKPITRKKREVVSDNYIPPE